MANPVWVALPVGIVLTIGFLLIMARVTRSKEKVAA